MCIGYTHTYGGNNVFVNGCVSMCMFLMFVLGNIWCKLDAVCLYFSNIVDQFGLSGLSLLSSVASFFFFSSFAGVLCWPPCTSAAIHRGAVQQFGAAVDWQGK